MIEPTLGPLTSTPEPDAAPVPAGAAFDAPAAAAALAEAPVAGEAGSACTQAQLRRFIKSRPYVPIHELRRRFALGGDDDDCAGFESAGRQVFVGLPAREARMLGDLVLQGDVGYELLLDPTSPMIVGVFPVRPVQRS